MHPSPLSCPMQGPVLYWGAATSPGSLKEKGEQTANCISSGAVPSADRSVRIPFRATLSKVHPPSGSMSSLGRGPQGWGAFLSQSEPCASRLVPPRSHCHDRRPGAAVWEEEQAGSGQARLRSTAFRGPMRPTEAVPPPEHPGPGIGLLYPRLQDACAAGPA